MAYQEVPASIPTGMIAFFHATTPPEGWLPCNGQNVSRTTYANLFAVIGTTYGSGDGSTTFNLPNLHHRFLEGTTTTSEVGSSVQAGLPNITGAFNAQANNYNNSNWASVVSGAFVDSKPYPGSQHAYTEGVRNFVSHGIIRAPDGFTYP